MKMKIRRQLRRGPQQVKACGRGRARIERGRDLEQVHVAKGIADFVLFRHRFEIRVQHRVQSGRQGKQLRQRMAGRKEQLVGVNVQQPVQPLVPGQRHGDTHIQHLACHHFLVGEAAELRIFRQGTPAFAQSIIMRDRGDLRMRGQTGQNRVLRIIEEQEQPVEADTQMPGDEGIDGIARVAQGGDDTKAHQRAGTVTSQRPSSPAHKAACPVVPWPRVWSLAGIR